MLMNALFGCVESRLRSVPLAIQTGIIDLALARRETYLFKDYLRCHGMDELETKAGRGGRAWDTGINT